MLLVLVALMVGQEVTWFSQLTSKSVMCRYLSSKGTCCACISLAAIYNTVRRDVGLG